MKTKYKFQNFDFFIEKHFGQKSNIFGPKMDQKFSDFFDENNSYVKFSDYLFLPRFRKSYLEQRAHITKIRTALISKKYVFSR